MKIPEITIFELETGKRNDAFELQRLAAEVRQAAAWARRELTAEAVSTKGILKDCAICSTPAYKEAQSAK